MEIKKSEYTKTEETLLLQEPDGDPDDPRPMLMVQRAHALHLSRIADALEAFGRHEVEKLERRLIRAETINEEAHGKQARASEQEAILRINPIKGTDKPDTLDYHRGWADAVCEFKQVIIRARCVR